MRKMKEFKSYDKNYYFYRWSHCEIFDKYHGIFEDITFLSKVQIKISKYVAKNAQLFLCFSSYSHISKCMVIMLG